LELLHAPAGQRLRRRSRLPLAPCTVRRAANRTLPARCRWSLATFTLGDHRRSPPSKSGRRSPTDASEQATARSGARNDGRLRVSLDLADLDPCTRRFMLAELDADVATGTL